MCFYLFNVFDCVVHGSVKDSVPLHKVLSPFSRTSVNKDLFPKIAAEIGGAWSRIALNTDTDCSIIIRDIRGKFPHSDDSSLAALEFLNHWFISRCEKVMICELYDILCDAGLNSLAVDKFRFHMMPDAASGLSLIQPSDRVTPDVIHVIADIGRDKWRDVGRYLNFSKQELAEYERFDTLQEKLYQVLHSWTDREGNASVGVLLDVCDKVEIGGQVRRELAAISSPQL